MAATSTRRGRPTGRHAPATDSTTRDALFAHGERAGNGRSTDDLASGRPWSERLASAALRRVRHAWNLWHRRPPAAAAALDWLVAAAPVGAQHAGLTASPGQFDPCPGLTGGVLATLATYGEWSLSGRLADWLLDVQLAEGAFPDAGLRRPSTLNTAQAAQGLLAAAAIARPGTLREQLELLANRACHYLALRGERRSARGKVLRRGKDADWQELVWLAPLARGAEQFAEPAWQARVDALRASCGDPLARKVWHAPLHVVLPEIEALLDIGERRLARRALRGINAAQRRDGAAPALPQGNWVSTTAVAHLAKIWYRLHEHERADRALAWLRRHQEVSGGFLGSYGRGACYYPRREVAWACKHFLDASRQQVAAAFVDHDCDTLDPQDGRLQTIVAWSRQFAAGAALVDAGCGRGRYLSALLQQRGDLQCIGIDPAANSVAALPAGIDGRLGSLPNLPLDDGAVDGALAIESLEHCLTPERAVAELCRVVRPGGQVLVIDKNRAHQPLSHCEPWERWFQPDEVSSWLAPYCHGVKCVAVPHAGHREATGLFLCWTATRQ